MSWTGAPAMARRQGGDVDVDRAGAEEEHVEEAFARPGFDVETVGVASRDRIGHARGQHERAAALGGPGADAACGG